MTRKLGLLLLLTLCLTVLCLSSAMAEQSGQCGDEVFWTLDDSGLLTISGDGPMYDYRSSPFPAANVKTVIIESGVTSLGNSVFRDCAKLTSVTLPDSLSVLGNKIFSGCTALESVVLPDGITDIAYTDAYSHPFQNWSGRIYASLGSETAIALSLNRANYKFCAPGCPNVLVRHGFFAGRISETSAWAYNTAITEAEIPAGVTAIPASAFRGCTCLTKIVIPEGVTSLGDFAFSGCESLSVLTLPESLTTLGVKILTGCSSLESVTLPSGITDIAYADQYSHTFHNWSGRIYAVLGSETAKTLSQNRADYKFCVSGYPNVLIKHSVSDGIITETSVWARGAAIAEAEIPAGVTAIAGSAFLGCANLTEIVVPEGVTSLGDFAFSGCESLSSITLPRSLTALGNRIFSGCSSLESVTLPDNITSISYTDAFSHAFHKWSGRIYAAFGSTTAKTLSQSRANYQFCVKGYPNVLLRHTVTVGDITDTSAWAYDTAITEAQIPEGVTVIADAAFRDCAGLTEIVIPEGVTALGDSAFRDCVSLSAVTLPESLTALGNYVFSGCSSLESVTLPDGITSIAYAGYAHAFIYWSGRIYAALGSETAKAVSQSPADYQFCVPDCPNVLVKHTIREGEITETSARAYDADITEAEIPEGVTTLPDGAFSACSALTDVYIPDSVAFIADSAFPKAHEILHMPCLSSALSWAVWQDYPPVNDTEKALSYGYAPVHQEAVDEAVAPTCTKTGLTEGTHCSVCYTVLIPQKTVKALGHEWLAPVYTWAEDNSTVTAAHVCARDAEHTETETANVKSSLLAPASCVTMGKTFYIVSFGNASFKPKAKIAADIPALSHDCVSPVYTWLEGNTAVQARATCARCKNEITETAATACRVIESPTESTKGTREYFSEAFRQAFFTVQRKTEQDIPALSEMKLFAPPALMTVLEEEAFAGISAEAVIIPDTCASIGDRAFADCPNLIYVRVPAGASVAENAFEGCSGILAVDVVK